MRVKYDVVVDLLASLNELQVVHGTLFCGYGTEGRGRTLRAGGRLHSIVLLCRLGPSNLGATALSHCECSFSLLSTRDILHFRERFFKHLVTQLFQRKLNTIGKRHGSRFIARLSTQRWRFFKGGNAFSPPSFC